MVLNVPYVSLIKSPALNPKLFSSKAYEASFNRSDMKILGLTMIFIANYVFFRLGLRLGAFS
jgi:hypothetical protein